MRERAGAVLMMSMLAGLLGLLIPAVVPANNLPDERHFGVFEMLEGKGVEVCEACFKALEAMPSDLTGCERPYDPELGFSVPEWTELDPLKNLGLLKKVMLLAQPPTQGISGTIFDGENFRREIKGQMGHGGISLSVAKIDINGDGRPEPVLKLRKGACINPHDALHVQYQTLVVVNDDWTTVDPTKTDLVTQNPRKRAGWPNGDVFNRLYNVFQYKGHLYFDKWDHDDSNFDLETFLIYEAVGNKVTAICKYRYERRFRSQTPGGTP